MARCAALHRILSLPAAAPPERLRRACMRLVLQCGCAALEAAAALPAGAQLPTQLQAEELLLRQLETLVPLLPVPGSGIAAPAAEATLLAAWLRPAAAASARVRTEARMIAQLQLSDLCWRACYEPQLAAYRAALQQSPEALAAILDALLPNLPMLAPALLRQQAGSEQQTPSSQLHPEGARRMLILLTSNLLEPALQGRLQVSDGSAAVAACLVSRQAAELAVGLASQLPRDGPVEQDQLLTAGLAVRFLGDAGRLVAAGLPKRMLSAQQQCQQRMLAALGPTANTFLANTCTVFAIIVDLLSSLCERPASGSPARHPPAGQPDILAWAAAASCALQALPLVAEFMQVPAAAQGQGRNLELPGMIRLIGEFRVKVSNLACGAVSPQPRPASLPPAAELEAMLPSLWQLHNAACSWVHWAAAHPTAAATCWLSDRARMVALLVPGRAFAANPSPAARSISPRSV